MKLTASSALAAAALVLAGCSTTQNPPPAKDASPAAQAQVVSSVMSRQVALMPYETQGVTVAGTTTWYDGQTEGLSAYAVEGGIVYVESRARDEAEKAFAEAAKSAAATAERANALAALAKACTPTGLTAESELLGRFSFYFASDESLYAHSQSALARFLAGDAPAKALHIVGYTDDIGTDDVNVPLSKARAETIAKHIRTAWPEVVVTVEGRGGCPRLVPNTTPENRAKNRRVEIYSLEVTQ